ncbi:GTP cyclohydrolase 1 type 2/Nif3 [Lipomyces chichibuensis]|uniref:GTP cyclohydrolase 1 type 2/Nif3 n=1 Tax=Lipomyces chichibuensis TaxID=1546026 RepID=UPI0033441929
MSKAVTVASTTRVLKSLISTVQQLFPVALADDVWDNTGLLLESPVIAPTTNRARVLLTIDLTTAVVDEALQKKALLIVAYHPIIFRPLKQITQSNTQQHSLLRLAHAGISVYSPHTAVDAQVGGMNDWLADIASRGQFLSTTVIQPSKNDPSGSTGFGRLVTLSKGMYTVRNIIENVKSGLHLKNVQVALADRHQDVDNATIATIAICAGSGGSVLSNTDADLWFTGELSHHEVLALRERGISAIICGHTNTERGYLTTGFAPKLGALIKSNTETLDADHYEKYDIEVMVSDADRDPITVF